MQEARDFAADPSTNGATGGDPADREVWTYKGYHMRPAEFNTAWVHFYRAEIQRSNTWRTRLDATTNWAVVTVAAAISFSLSSANNHYAVLLLDTVLITLFAWIEARRYRYYELFSYRARLIETNFFAAMLTPPFSPDPDWGEKLASSLRSPQFTISALEAFGRRLRHNYLWIFVILALAWLLKNYSQPFAAQSLDQFFNRASLGPVPGQLMVALGILYNGVIFLIAGLSVRLHHASGEIDTFAGFHVGPD